MAKRKSMAAKADDAEALVRIERAQAQRASIREQRKIIKTAASRIVNIPRRASSPSFAPTALHGSYDSVTRNRLNTFKPAPLAPADTHLDEATLANIRRDTQHLYRSNPLARAMVGRMSDAVCGPQGPNLILASKDKAWAKEAAAKFWKWATNNGPDKFDSMGRQSLMETVRAAIPCFQLDGDFACVYYSDGSVRLVEAAEIASPPKNIAGQRKVVSGVEYDANGAPVALWVASTPPGGNYNIKDHRRIPWETLTLLRNPSHRRLNQTRGEPGLAASIRYLELIDTGIDATVLAYNIATFTALVVKANDPSAFGNSAIAQTAALDGASNPAASGAPQEIAWEPGGVMTIGKDEDISAIKPEHPAASFDPFMKSLVRYVGSDPGMPLELTMLDASQTNYHGFKSAVGNAYRAFAWAQYQLSEWLTTLATWRLGLWIQSGELAAPEDWDAVEWRFAGPPIINPKEEYEAVSFAIGQRLKSRAQGLQDIGYTGPVEDLDDAIKSELEDMRAKGIEPEAVPGSPGANGGNGKPQLDEEGNPIPGTEGGGMAKASFLVGDKTVAAQIGKDTKAGTLDRQSGISILTKLVGVDQSTAESIAVEPDPIEVPPTATAPATQ